MNNSRYDNESLDALADAAVAVPSRNMCVDDFVGLVLREWRDSDPRTGQTVTRMGEIIVRFAKRLRMTGVYTTERINETVCVGFIDAPSRTGALPSDATRHFRRVTLRALFRTGRDLGVIDDDPTLDLELPPRSSTTTRPLSTDEIVLCRTSTFPARATDLRRPTAWALAEATAATSEIPSIRRRDLRYTQSGELNAVWLPGTRRLMSRTVELTDWAVTIIARRLDELSEDPDVPLAYVGAAAVGSVARHASACGLIAAVLNTSGLGIHPDVRPASVRNWRARQAFNDGATIEAVATMLGHRRLDEAAEAIDHDWRPL